MKNKFIIKDKNYLNIKLIKYLNSLKETNFTPNKKSLVYKYELKASQLYDLINNTNTFEFEYKNQPIIKK